MASAVVSKVICVPWQGDITKQHTALAGTPAKLTAVVKTTAAQTIYYRWVFGDGSQSGVSTATVLASGNTPLQIALEVSHTYAGAVGTPFTAQLQVADSGATGSPGVLNSPIADSYLLKIEDNTLDARINVAIDNGLWYIFKQGVKGTGVSGSILTYDHQPYAYWINTGGFHPGVYAAPTASAIHAFQINGSKETGNFDEDPYAEYAALGLKFLIMGYRNGNPNSPVLRAMTLSLQHGDNPDMNGNGIGIETYDSGVQNPIYQGGQVMDAIIASGTPGRSSGRDFIGNGHLATYGEIIQDMTDMFSWGQYDGAQTCHAVEIGTEDLSVFGVPQSITLEMVNTQCGNGGTFELSLNGVVLGSVPNDPGGSCTCSPPLQTFVVNNAAALSAGWNASAAKIVRVTYTGGGYNANVRAKLDWGGGNVKTICVRSVAPDCFSNYLCDGYNSAAFDNSVSLINVPVFTNICANMGSWQYNWQCCNDNSASQWAAIGMIPAQEPPWNAIVPDWVKSYDDAWLNESFYTSGAGSVWGHFGYTGPTPLGCPGYPCPASGATTPSGMVQLSFAGKTTADSRWMKSERWMAENWDTGDDWFGGAKGNLYAMYAMAKAMRLAKPAPVVNFVTTGFDWYRGNASHMGVAKALSDTIIANGYYNQTFWEGHPLATAWAVIILKPTLFTASPIACFTAHPNPAYSDLPIAFDPTCSGHSEPGKGIANIVKYEWDWNNDGTYEEMTSNPDVLSHSFHCAAVPCTFPVKLRVTDDVGSTATFVMNINITDPPHPPVSRPKKEYWVSLCSGDTLALDGSDSFDPDEGQHQSGCAGCPNDTITAWEWDLNGAPFTYTDGTGEILDLGAGFGTFFPTAGSYDIGLRVTDNTAASYPASMQANLKDEAFSKVVVFAGVACDLTATGGCDSVHLAWSGSGAAEYRIYGSLTGPNSDFVELANAGVSTSADVAATLGQKRWFRVMAISGNDSMLSKPVAVTLAFTDCVCIRNLVARPKDRQIQLTWAAQAGATCYNIYRDTVPNVQCIAAKRIRSCFVAAALPAYLDTGLVNGTKYYYKVTKVVNGVETCVSNEASGTPLLPRR